MFYLDVLFLVLYLYNSYKYVFDQYVLFLIHHELGINCRFYDLRGSFATKTLRKGCEIKDIAKVLGHSRIETTENYYINCTKDNLKNVSNSFEKELGLNMVD